MAVLRPTDYSIQTGHVTVGSFTTNHRIVNFAVQSDQGSTTDPDIPWTNPLITPEKYPTPPEIITSMSSKAFPNGFYTWTWTFSIWTPLMVKYWEDTFLTSGVWSKECTVKTYNRYEQAMYLQARMMKPQIITPLRGAGFSNIQIEFKRGVVIT